MKSMKRKMSEHELESSFSGKSVLNSSKSHRRHSITKVSHRNNDSKTKEKSPKIQKIKLKVRSKRNTVGTSSMRKEKLIKPKHTRNSTPGCSTKLNLGHLKDSVKRKSNKKRKTDSTYAVIVDSDTESIPSVTSLLNDSTDKENIDTGSEGRNSSFGVLVKTEPIDNLHSKIIEQARELGPESTPSVESESFNFGRAANRSRPRKTKVVKDARKTIRARRKSRLQSTGRANDTVFNEPHHSDASIAGGDSFDFDACSDVELYQEIMSVTSFAGTLANFALNQRLMNYIRKEYKNKPCMKNREVRRKLFEEMFRSVLFYKKHLKDRTAA